MADKKDEKKEEKAASKEIISNKAALYLIIALLILAATVIYAQKKGTSQTQLSWNYQEEKFWERGKFVSVAASNVVIEPNFISFSGRGTKELFGMKCVRVNSQSPKFTCGFSGENGRVTSGPDKVWMKKIGDFLYEGEIGFISYKGRQYKNIKISLRGGG